MDALMYHLYNKSNLKNKSLILTVGFFRLETFIIIALSDRVSIIQTVTQFQVFGRVILKQPMFDQGKT